MSLQVQNLLNAMDGVSLILDTHLRITHVGERNWDDFFQQNAPEDLTSQATSAHEVIGQDFMSYVMGNTVKSTYTSLFNRVINHELEAIHVDYRCDAPEVRRDMRMSVTRIQLDDSPDCLLYQSILLSALPRPPVNLFGVPVTQDDGDDIVTLCSICARVAWPVGPSENREWISASEYYRRGGEEVHFVSHGFCRPCFDDLMRQ